MDRSLNIYVLTVDPGRRLFYSDPLPLEEPRPIAAKGVKGWAERRFQALKTGLAESQGTAARTTRAVWHWLHSRTNPDEVLLSRLRSASRVVIHYPPTMSPEETETLWKAFLTKARRRHLPWLAANLVVSPVTVVLAPLPGPNLIGYWFVYRAFHHLMILIGLRHLKSERISTHFDEHPSLDRDFSGPEGLEHLKTIGHDRDEPADFFERQRLLKNGEASKS